MYGSTGEPRFSAPEMTTHQHYDARVDIYSAGIALYFMLSGGDCPFTEKSDTKYSITTAMLANQYPKLFYLTEGMQGLLTSLLEGDPKKRLTAREALSHPIFDALA